MIKNYLAVGFGGALGAILRVMFVTVLPISLYKIPVQILIVNILGCFIMGIVTELLTQTLIISDITKHFIISGLLGGFTTFSAFAFEFGSLFNKQKYFLAFVYIFFSFGLSLVFFFLGLNIMKFCLKSFFETYKKF